VQVLCFGCICFFTNALSLAGPAMLLYVVELWCTLSMIDLLIPCCQRAISSIEGAVHATNDYWWMHRLCIIYATGILQMQGSYLRVQGIAQGWLGLCTTCYRIYTLRQVHTQNVHRRAPCAMYSATHCYGRASLVQAPL
jgi:hypothetical protein